MVRFCLLLFCSLLFSSLLFAWQKESIISKEDLSFLENMTKSVMDSSRILPGQSPGEAFGFNNTGGTLIRPGGRNTYPAFWIRDYAMSLETGFVSVAEQKHMLLLTAQTQCDQTWITKGGGMIPLGAIADHIRVDNSLPIYFPGTYDYVEQGTGAYGVLPPYCDQFYFIKMASYYIIKTGDYALLSKEINGTKLIDRLETAFKVPSAKKETHIVYTTENLRAVDFGFRDAIVITGDLCYPSILKYTSALELAELFNKQGNKAKAAAYKDIAQKIKAAIPLIFLDKGGLLRASTGKSSQPDVWSTALAVYTGILDGDDAKRAGTKLADAYSKGMLAYKGNIRHVLKEDDYSSKSAWESTSVPLNEYQNGAYWGTPTGWVAYAISLVNTAYAKRLVKEYITDLKENDYRKGPAFSAPLECFYPPSYTSGPVYLATVSCPYIVFKSMEKGR